MVLQSVCKAVASGAAGSGLSTFIAHMSTISVRTSDICRFGVLLVLIRAVTTRADPGLTSRGAAVLPKLVRPQATSGRIAVRASMPTGTAEIRP